MNRLAIFFLAITITSLGSAQQQPETNLAGGIAVTSDNSTESAVPKVSRGDVINISVYDAPELTHNVVVDADGNIRLPMVRRHIHAAGLLPDEVEKAIEAALVDEQVMVNPIVMVTPVEYHGRAISVVGAVKNQVTFQATGTDTLLESIVRAGGVSEVAGSDILITHPASSGNRSIGLTDRIPVRSLMDPTDPAAGLPLEGGDTIRVPVEARIFIVGNVKHPGPLQIPEGPEGSDSTVLKAITLAGGLDSFTSRKAFIYRVDKDSRRTEKIPLEIKKIMTLKAPDVPLHGNDLVYVPNATGQRISSKALAVSLTVGLTLAGLLIYLIQ